MSILAMFVITFIKVVIVIVALLTSFAYLTYAERKFQARVQVRIGPDRAGLWGLLQPIADAIKMIMKEDIIPDQADKVLFIMAPALSVIMALCAFACIPIGPTMHLFGYDIEMSIANVNVGLLYTLAILSLNVYGIVLGGWASGNKYSFLGGMRSTAQMISYELAMGMSIIGVVLLGNSLNLTEIVDAQKTVPFAILQPVGFLIFLVCMFADTNRAPFDLPEAETELVAGYHTEYSSIKYALFYMAEYINMVTVSCLAVVLYWGGWHGPFAPGFWWFSLKVAVFIVLFMWVRASYPRFRYDHLMKFGWKLLLPLAILNVLVTSFAIAMWGN
jgi:NADH-quinone oxidoreductase subunit H